MTSEMPAVLLRADDRTHGFRVTRVTPLQDMRVVAYELTHEKSGARLLHLHAGDPENLLTTARPRRLPSHKSAPP